MILLTVAVLALYSALARNQIGTESSSRTGIGSQATSEIKTIITGLSAADANHSRDSLVVIGSTDCDVCSQLLSNLLDSVNTFNGNLRLIVLAITENHYRTPTLAELDAHETVSVIDIDNSFTQRLSRDYGLSMSPSYLLINDALTIVNIGEGPSVPSRILAMV